MGAWLSWGLGRASWRRTPELRVEMREYDNNNEKKSVRCDEALGHSETEESLGCG